MGSEMCIRDSCLTVNARQRSCFSGSYSLLLNCITLFFIFPGGFLVMGKTNWSYRFRLRNGCVLLIVFKRNNNRSPLFPWPNQPGTLRDLNFNFVPHSQNGKSSLFWSGIGGGGVGAPPSCVVCPSFFGVNISILNP